MVNNISQLTQCDFGNRGGRVLRLQLSVCDTDYADVIAAINRGSVRWKGRARGFPRCL